MKGIRVGSYLILVAVASCFFMVSGCVPSAPAPKKEKKIFYPDPPEPPRYQFLRSFTGSKDFEEEQTQFDAFVIGRKKGGLKLDKPYGVAAGTGSIYVADTNFSVMEFNLKKQVFKQLEGAQGLGKVVQPINLTIDENGNKFVADSVRRQILMYDADDFFIKSFRPPGSWRPVDVASFGRFIFVADRDSRQVYQFDIDSGDLIKKIGQEGAPDERLGLPLNLAVSKDGIIYVSDTGRFQIVSYDLDGHYLGAIGKAGNGPGFFARPRGIAVDPAGRIYVVDAAFDYVQVFHESGQLLTFFGGPGSDPGNLNLPAGITLDYENVDLFRDQIAPKFEVEYLIIVVSQFGDRLVNVYGFGKEQGRTYPSLDELRLIREQQLQELDSFNQ